MKLVEGDGGLSILDGCSGEVGFLSMELAEAMGLRAGMEIEFSFDDIVAELLKMGLE